MEPQSVMDQKEAREIVTVRMYAEDRERIRQVARKTDTWPEILHMATEFYLEYVKELSLYSAQ